MNHQHGEPLRVFKNVRAVSKKRTPSKKIIDPQWLK